MTKLLLVILLIIGGFFVLGISFDVLYDSNYGSKWWMYKQGLIFLIAIAYTVFSFKVLSKN